ncbi:hypothetical protein JW865_06240 [Candidatus Bathyarchaeota archaeon]|nr:hypothetical protein [Candidatus Bathyarchaeota archaeon]
MTEVDVKKHLKEKQILTSQSKNRIKLQVNIDLPESFYNIINSFCELANITQSEFINSLIVNSLTELVYATDYVE